MRMSYTLNSFNWVIQESIEGTVGVVKGDARSLDYNPYYNPYNPLYNASFPFIFHLILHY